MSFQVVFFTNSGTEANELAMMIARLYTGFHDIISLRNAYHGNAAATMSATAQCNYKFNVVQVYFSLKQVSFFLRDQQLDAIIIWFTTGRPFLSFKVHPVSEMNPLRIMGLTQK